MGSRRRLCGLGELGSVAGRIRDAGQADMRGLVTAGRCCSAGAVRLSRIERHPSLDLSYFVHAKVRFLTSS